jgi:hypothetical protein
MIVLDFSVAGIKNLIVGPWFIDPNRKERIGFMTIGSLLEKFSTLADSLGLLPFWLPRVMTSRL